MLVLDLKPRTKRELEERRKLELRSFASTYMEKWMNSHPITTEISLPNSPPPVSLTSIYTKDPKIRTKTELDSFRKQKILEDNSGSADFTHLTLSQRVEEREKKIFITSNTVCDRTSRLLQRKMKDIKKYEEIFSNRPVGVHGIELPKFSENCQDYWKLKTGYNDTPVLSKNSYESRPVSEYKGMRSRSANREIPLKPNQNNPFPNFEISKEVRISEKRPVSRPRFTDEFYATSSTKSLQEPVHDQKRENFRIVFASTPKSESSKKQRPSTANSLKPGKNGRNTVRSQGFT